MKIVNLAGGLGNQMFQYAFALMLQERYPDECVMIDTQHYHSLFFKRFGSVNLHNGYEIDKIFPNATLQKAGFRDLIKVTYYIPNYIASRISRRLLPIRATEYVSPYSENYSFNEAVFTSGDRYYEGYWQCAAYYHDIQPLLRHTFAPPAPNEYNASMIDRIKNSRSVGIHVRRGDYKYAPELNGICNTAYYAKAIAKATEDGEKRTFFVFSNDMAWCKEHLQPMAPEHDMVFVEGNKGKDSCWDMFLMTYCSQLIIANSSFSWWGAFLNGSADAVYAPYPWIHRDCSIEIYPPEWIQIN